MALANTDLILRPGVLNSDSIPAQNGGRMAYTEVVSGVKNALLPDVSASERENGKTRWRKVFLHINSDTTTALNNARVFMDKLTNSDDYLLIQPGTATGAETIDADDALMFGVATLSADAAAGATVITVNCEHADYATLAPFRAGMKIRISNIPTGGGAGTEEFVVLTAVAYAGAVATLTFTGSPLANAYLAATPTVVSGVIEQASVAGGFNSPVVTSAAGTFSPTGNLLVPSKGSITESWTLTFSSATAFTVSGTTVGALAGTGSRSASYSATNPSTSTPYFTIPAGAWGGTFAAGNTVTFNTTQAALPLWVRQRVPAGAGSIAGNVGAIAVRGESA